MLNGVDGALQLAKGLPHGVKGLLHLRRDLGQRRHLALGLLHTPGHRGLHLEKLLGGLADVGKGPVQILQLDLEMVRVLQHAGEGRAYLPQLPQGGDLLVDQHPLVLLQALRHVQQRIEAGLLLDPAGLPLLSRK